MLYTLDERRMPLGVHAVRADHGEPETRKHSPKDWYVGGEFRIVTDPDCSWGMESTLSYDDIMRLLNQDFLTPGTEFAREPMRRATHRVIQSEGGCILIQIETKQVVKPPYWRTKKLCRSMTQSVANTRKSLSPSGVE